MGHVGKKKSLIFYLSKSSHIAAQKKIERKLTFLRNTTNVNRYQLLTTLAYVLDSSASHGIFRALKNPAKSAECIQIHKK